MTRNKLVVLVLGLCGAGALMAYPVFAHCGKCLDSGKAIVPELAKNLLHAPVNSSTGLGIGLYQAARHAEASGYALTLAENRDGEVCFLLLRAG